MRILLFILTLSAIVASPSHAALTTEKSRVVFNSDQRETTLRLLNDGKTPILVQAWIDDGDVQGTPETAAETPAIPLPALFRIEPGKVYPLRIIATGMSLPTDRESLFWLNLNEIPASRGRNAEQTEVKVQVKLQFKFFYRPARIRQQVEDRAKSQRFTLTRQTNGFTLEVSNPTPFYTVFSRAEVTGAANNSLPVKLDMLAPFSSQRIELPATAGRPEKIRYATIDDSGAEVITERTLK